MSPLKISICLTALLTGACAAPAYNARRPLSSCAQQLVEEKYVTEAETVRADRFCGSWSEAQLDCAKREYFVRHASDAPFVMSEACAAVGTRKPAVAVVVSRPAAACTTLEPALEPAIASRSSAKAHRISRSR